MNVGSPFNSEHGSPTPGKRGRADYYMGTKIIKARPSSKNGREGYMVVYEDGYQSWSPKNVFEKAYAVNGELSFSHALEALRKGFKVARRGWNASGQYITKIPAGNAMFHGFDMQDCLGIKNAQGKMQPGWVPSQGDLFATDWFVIGELDELLGIK